MDLADKPDDSPSEGSPEETYEDVPESPRKLPDDLPKSLDDRRSFTSYGGETEMYDAWQGSSNCFPDVGPRSLMMLCCRWNRLIPIYYNSNPCETTCI